MSAPKPRPAEDIAREMVSDAWTMTDDDGSISYRSAIEAPGGHVPLHLGPLSDDAADGVKVARLVLAGIIEQSRAEGEAAKEAGLREVVSSHAEAIDHYREGLHRIWQGEADPRSVAADYLGEDPPSQQPRDLAGRIRALCLKYAARSLDSSAMALRDGNDEEAYEPSSVVVSALRAAYLDACAGVDLGFRIRRIRGGPTCSSETRAELDRAADELETIVRDAGEKR